MHVRHAPMHTFPELPSESVHVANACTILCMHLRKLSMHWKDRVDRQWLLSHDISCYLLPILYPGQLTCKACTVIMSL